MTNPIIFKIVSCDRGYYYLNQEANGYWWYHDTPYETKQAAAAAVELYSTERFPAVIDQKFVPRNMRPRRM